MLVTITLLLKTPSIIIISRKLISALNKLA